MTRQPKSMVPKVRFKGFTDEWEQRKLENMVHFFNGLTYKPNDIRKSGTFVIRSSNIQNGAIVSSDDVFVRNEIANSTNVKIGDIIVVVRNGSRKLIGKHAIVTVPMNNTVIGAFMTGIRTEHYNFINALLSTLKFKDELRKNMGATINQITGYMFSNMKFMFPNDQEMDRIGTFLRKLDNLITLQQRKLDQLNTLKKGLLQKMLADKKHLQPQLRFKGYADDWKWKKLGELANIKTGSRNHQDSIENGKYPFYVRSEKIEHLNEYDYDTEAILVPGDGKIGEIFHYINGKFALHQRVYKLDEFNGIDAHFLLCLLKQNFKKHALRLNAQGTVPSLRLPMFTKWEILIPSISEQEQIGKNFIILNNMILAQQSKLDKLNSLKKSLLQNMFI